MLAAADLQVDAAAIAGRVVGGPSPDHGGWPVSISNSVAPSAYRSVRADTGWPITCSGAM